MLTCVPVIIPNTAGGRRRLQGGDSGRCGVHRLHNFRISQQHRFDAPQGHWRSCGCCGVGGRHGRVSSGLICGQHSPGHKIRCRYRGSPVRGTGSLVDGHHQHRTSPGSRDSLRSCDISVELVSHRVHHLQRHHLVNSQNYSTTHADKLAVNSAHNTSQTEVCGNLKSVCLCCETRPANRAYHRAIGFEYISAFSNFRRNSYQQALKFPIHSATISKCSLGARQVDNTYQQQFQSITLSGDT